MQKREEQRIAIIFKLGGKCCQCGFDDPRALQIDHVDSDGKEHRVKSKSAHSYASDVLSGKAKVQLLCANCHAIKTHEDRKAGRIRSKGRAKWIGM